MRGSKPLRRISAMSWWCLPTRYAPYRTTDFMCPVLRQKSMSGTVFTVLANFTMRGNSRYSARRC